MAPRFKYRILVDWEVVEIPGDEQVLDSFTTIQVLYLDGKPYRYDSGRDVIKAIDSYELQGW